MDYSHVSILLLLLSLALLVAEVFVPSGGFIAVLMLIALTGSVFCAFRAWWHESPGLWWSYVATVVVLLPAVLIGAFTVFPRTPYGRRILLDAPEPSEIAGFAREQEELQRLVGKRGRTVTPHFPGGMIAIEGRRHHAETRGMMLDAGQDVEVVAVKGNRLVIRLADAPPAADSLVPPDVAAAPTTVAGTPPPAADTSVAAPSTDDPAAFDPFDPFAAEDESRPA